MTNEPRVPTRMGDGTFTQLTRSEIRADLVAGSEVAAKRAKVPLLTDDEIDHLLEIYASPLRFIGVDVGEEIVLSCDGTGMKTHATRIQDLQCYEQWMGADLLELCVGDYSLKVVRTILAYEAQYMHDAQLCTIAPLQYGVMPNLGLYSKPDGPCENWNELLPLGKIAEARAAAEEAVEMAVVDMVKLADSQWEAGADAIDWDTTGASGDPEFLAALRATKIIREKYPDMGVQLGMAGEFVLGMHGELEWDGVRLAGLWPREQLLLAQKAGATMFGPVVNINTGKSLAWNMARAIALIKPCMEVADDPGPPQRRHGRRRRADVRPPALRRGVPGGQVVRRAAARRRVVGGLGRSARDAQRPRAGREHRRYSGRRRPGCPYADDSGHAPQGSQAVRRRQARRHAVRPLGPGRR